MEAKTYYKGYDAYFKAYYEQNKDKINERRRLYAREHQRLYNAEQRQRKMENGTYRPRGRPRKTTPPPPEN